MSRCEPLRTMRDEILERTEGGGNACMVSLESLFRWADTLDAHMSVLDEEAPDE